MKSSIRNEAWNRLKRVREQRKQVFLQRVDASDVDKVDCILEEEVEELAPLRVKDLPLIKTEEPEKYYELLSNFLKETKGSLGVIWNSFEGLETPALTKLSKEFSIPIFPIGPFHKYFSSSSSSSSLILRFADKAIDDW
ncbi:hypothetical protein VIGAN_04358000 [Vigna angularis var. angularis]|uniref:Uncharacterized protein n=1 Tax=Vigna angularis var. angularis TaxID=157739 RepID=A0A0S3RZH5_PHAAN|nr:hypothetical protein VIGAN_04358000 [Vigna angularis var. angularis]